MKYSQAKYWTTRRIHLFTDGEYSICGVALRVGSYRLYRGKKMDWEVDNSFHGYDDLNYCQSCRRKAETTHGRKYKPLTKLYPNPGEKR